MYARKERLNLRRYCKLGRSGGMPPPPPGKFSNFRGSEMPFPAFSAGPFQQINTEKKTMFSCLFYISSVYRYARYSIYRKKGKTVTPSRRLQATAEGETSTLQTGKYTKIMRKIYHSFRLNDKNAFRKLEIYNYIFDISNCVDRRICVYGRYSPDI